MNINNLKKSLLLICLLGIISNFCINLDVYANEKKVDLVYFSSSTCGSCVEVNEILENIKTKYKNVNIIKYDISDLNNIALLNEYCKKYKVESEKKGSVPVVIVRDKYLYGVDEIKEKINSIIKNDINTSTILIKYSDVNENSFENQNNIFNSLGMIKVFFLALINGVNPCSVSMLLFLIMLLSNNIKIIKKVTFGFCIGKILTFILLGSICFDLINKIYSSDIIMLLNILFSLIFLYLSVINFVDYFNIKKSTNGKIRAQLPTTFRKFNHNIMVKFSQKFINSKFILLLSMVLGVLIGCSEFLCSGQIYLSVIVTVIQTDAHNIMEGMLYLIIYSFSYSIPLISIIYFIAKGKEVFKVSDFFCTNLHKIKFVYGTLFLIFFAYTIICLL